MFTLYWVLIIGLLFFSLLVLLFYHNDRSENKQKLNDFIENRQSSRELTQEELKLLEPYLTNKKAVYPYKLESLIDHKVSQIQGGCNRHELICNGQVHHYYYEIDNIEVFFPYHMERFIRKFNKVEIVLTKDYAIVININNRDLDLAFNYNDQAFTRGTKLKQIQKSSNDENKLTDDEDNNSYDNTHKITIEKRIEYDTLFNREETPLEAKNRNRGNYGILTSMCLVFATLLFINSWLNQKDLGYHVISILICLVIAIVCLLFRSKRLTNLHQVKIIKAKIFEKDTINNTMRVDENTNLTYPQYWSIFLPDTCSTPTEMDMVEDNKKLLRYGNTLSINHEVEKFGPPKFLNRNKVLFFIGVILSIVLYFFSEPINNTILAHRYYNTQLQNWQIKDLISLNKSNIKHGDLVNITIQGTSCDVDTINKNNQCYHLFINTKPIEDNKIISNAETIKKLFDKDFVKTVQDEEMLKFEKIQDLIVIESNKGMYSSYQHKAIPFVKLINMGQMVIDINNVCYISNIECRYVKTDFLNLYNYRGYNEEYWNDLLKKAELFPAYAHIVEKNKVDSLIRSLYNLKVQLIYELKNSVSQYQLNNSNVEINLTGNSYIEIAQLDSINNLKTDDNLKEAVNYYYNILMSNESNISLIGLIDDINYREDNTISELKINSKDYYHAEPQKLFSLTSPVVINVFMFAIMVFVVIFNGFLILWKVRFNRRRLNQISQYYKDRMV